MITLFFYQTTPFSIASISEQWRDLVSVNTIIHAGQVQYIVRIQVIAEDSSYRYRALMQKPQLVLKFSLPFFFEFPVGTMCDFQNQRFILTKPENLKRQGNRKIEYTMTLGTNEDYMSIWKLRNSVDNRLKFSMCAKPHEFIEEIVKNLNKKDTSLTWQVGECIESSEKTVEFNHAYIDAALTDIANTFETEYEVEYVGTIAAKIHLRKVEYFKDSPVALSYGKGNGFIPGVGRTSDANGEPVKRLFVEGTTRNIDRSKYGAPELLLPKGQSLEYEGRTYTSSQDGTSIERTDIVSTAIKEDSLDCTEIYPSRIGTVSSVLAVKPEKNYYDFIDNSIPATLNFNDYIIAGESMTVIFQSGMLAGKEFDIRYKHDERRFEIVPQEFDGVTMPNETFKVNADPNNPDTYAVFGVMLPDDYICNNNERSGASWDMFRAAAKALYECEDQKFTFSGQLQSLWAKRNWLAIGGQLVVGGYVLFTDEQFAANGVKIRIVGIKDFINSPYSPTIELSNAVSGASVSSQLRQIENTEVVIEDTKRSVLEFTKRRFRDAKETIEMLEEAMLDNFTNSVSPIAVRTMAMLIGDEALQFRFIGIDNNGNTAVRSDVIGYDQNNKKLVFSARSANMDIYLQHLTLDINSISSEHAETEYKKWKMKDYTSPVFADGSKRYYVYAKCNRTESLGGEIVVSEDAIKMESDAQSYHFLIGILNSESDGERSFVTLYGFTEILPGRITTDRIVCSDGESFLDLANSALVLGDAFDYNSKGDKTLRLKFLLSENANLGGWIFRNNRLESQNGTLYLDGVKGEVNIGGVIRFATANQGKLTDANLVWLPNISEEKTITVLCGREHLGKVIKCFNSNPFGGKNWRIALKEYTYHDYSDRGEMFQGEEQYHSLYYVIVRPQETIEIAYLQKAYTGDGGPKSFAGRWELVSRFSQELFINDTDIGRFPRMIAIGRLNYSNGNVYISGDWWNGKSITSKLTPSRLGEGKYRISFSNADVPNGYKVLVSGYGAIAKGSNFIKAGVWETASGYFDVYTSDDESNNDGSFDFMIFAPNWWYDLKSD